MVAGTTALGLIAICDDYLILAYLLFLSPPPNKLQLPGVAFVDRL